ncbi:response regulator transcription factor [Paenibacillus eucommiae]|uniref:Two-component system response regulator YesN n=1 Tax=Paenibacillus eucommiae TaxID=1355755 RepID=A0ABS4IWE8_9BACL|nr:response regulator [Paenibacillus eucommiae]MBP1991892.1 two-component system response regulator YesN [Paenibacillus eucommiae]
MNIVIVDDEEEIREGLRVMVSQLHDTGIDAEVVAVCSDGYAALDVLMTKQVDLVISDVRMPGMDGLILTQTVTERYPDVQVIILSGYEEFTYVQQALRYGATDYLLKPIGGDELLLSLKRAKKGYNQKQKKTIHWTWEQFIHEEAPCKAVVVGDPDETASPRAKEFGQPITLAWLFHKSVSEVMEQWQGVCFLQETVKREQNNVVLGLYAQTEVDLEQMIEAITGEVSRFWSGKIRIPVSFGISSLLQPQHEARTYYLQACHALFGRLLTGSGIRRSSADGSWDSAPAKLYLETLHSAWELGDYDSYLKKLQSILSELFQRKELHQLLYGVESILLSLAVNVQPYRRDIGGMAAVDVSLFMEKMLWSRCFEDLRESVLQWVTALIEQNAPEKQEGQVLSRAKQYIRENLHKPLSLAEAGKATYVSPHYLSRLFRERAGTTFLEYLTELRMEEAKRLLKEPGIKIYEVAEQVGYGSWKHFSRTFKERTSYGPAEYRKEVSPD